MGKTQPFRGFALALPPKLEKAWIRLFWKKCLSIRTNFYGSGCRSGCQWEHGILTWQSFNPTVRWLYCSMRLPSLWSNTVICSFISWLGGEVPPSRPELGPTSETLMSWICCCVAPISADRVSNRFCRRAAASWKKEKKEFIFFHALVNITNAWIPFDWWLYDVSNM